MKKHIWRIIFCAGILVLLGTVGANDAGTIDTGRFMLQTAIGAAMSVSGLFKGKLTA